MFNSQIRFYNENASFSSPQLYQEFENFEPEYVSQESQNLLNSNDESNQKVNRFQKNTCQNSIAKKRISKKNKSNIILQQEWKHLNGLLDKFIKDSIKEANKGQVFKQLHNCQEIKQFIDKMERTLINMKSLLLSHMLSRKC